MRFPTYGQYSLDFSGNVLEVFATGAWNAATTDAMIEEMQDIVAQRDGAPWAALMDGRRWVLSTPASQKAVAEAIRKNLSYGLKRSAYVLDPGMVKKAQLERTHPDIALERERFDYERQYFHNYFDALKWLRGEGYAP